MLLPNQRIRKLAEPNAECATQLTSEIQFVVGSSKDDHFFFDEMVSSHRYQSGSYLQQDTRDDFTESGKETVCTEGDSVQ